MRAVRLPVRSRLVSTVLLPIAHEHIVDAAMVGLDTPRAKRKVTSHPTEESHSKDETYLNHRPKRTRRSIGGPATPVKTPRDERAGDRSMKRFEGVVLVSRRRSTRPSQDVGAVVSKEDDGSSEHNEESVGNLKDEGKINCMPFPYHSYSLAVLCRC